MVKTNKSLNIALAVLFAALVLYLGFALLRRSQSGYTTTQAVMVTVNETGQAQGYVVRREHVLTASKAHVSVYVNEARPPARRRDRISPLAPVRGGSGRRRHGA